MNDSMEFGLVNDFIDHLYTLFGTTSTYNAIGDTHFTVHWSTR
jgi:hypothetical protein